MKIVTEKTPPAADRQCGRYLPGKGKQDTKDTDKPLTFHEVFRKKFIEMYIERSRNESFDDPH